MKKESVHRSSLCGYVYLPDFPIMSSSVAMSVGYQFENLQLHRSEVPAIFGAVHW